MWTSSKIIRFFRDLFSDRCKFPLEFMILIFVSTISLIETSAAPVEPLKDPTTFGAGVRDENSLVCVIGKPDWRFEMAESSLSRYCNKICLSGSSNSAALSTSMLFCRIGRKAVLFNCTRLSKLSVRRLFLPECIRPTDSIDRLIAYTHTLN